MARKYQEAEKMQTCAVRMGASMLHRIDAYGARLKAQHPGLRVERADAVRDLMLKALALVEGKGTECPLPTPSQGNGPPGPGDAGGGPVLAVGQDLSPIVADQSLPKAAQPQDQNRTTGRTGRKRPTAAKGDTHGAARVR